MIIFNFY